MRKRITALDNTGIIERTANNGEPRCHTASSEGDSGLGSAPILPSVIVGRIVAMHDGDMPSVDFPGNTSGRVLPARSVVSVSRKEIGREAALMFEDGDPARPVILGVIQKQEGSRTPTVEVEVEKQSLIIDAKKEIVLRCGKASITLTSSGKILIQGEYLVSRSSGVNKIRGGSVQIN